MRFEPQTITVTDNKDCPDTAPLAISPVLETGSTAPMSTHWIPLHELITHWTAVDTLLLPAPVAPVLAAIGHALLALSGETSALRLFSRAWQRRERTPRGAAIGLEQAAHCLDRAAREWALAAGRLDSLSPTDVEQEALHARSGSRVSPAPSKSACGRSPMKYALTERRGALSRSRTSRRDAHEQRLPGRPLPKPDQVTYPRVQADGREELPSPQQDTPQTQHV